MIIGLAAALWSASGYVGAFSRASNAIYEIEEGRPFWKLRPLQLAISLLLILFVAVSAIAVVLTGPLAEEVGSLFGLGSTAVALHCRGDHAFPQRDQLIIGVGEAVREMAVRESRRSVG